MAKVREIRVDELLSILGLGGMGPSLEDLTADFIRRWASAFRPKAEHMNEIAEEVRTLLKAVADEERWPSAADDDPEADPKRPQMERQIKLLEEFFGKGEGVGQFDSRARDHLACFTKVHYATFVYTKHAFTLLTAQVPPELRPGMMTYLVDAIMKGIEASQEAVTKVDEKRKERREKKREEKPATPAADAGTAPDTEHE